MVALGAVIINTSGQTPEQSSQRILAEIKKRMGRHPAEGQAAT